MRAPHVLLAVGAEPNAFFYVAEIVMNNPEDIVDERLLTADDLAGLREKWIGSGIESGIGAKPVAGREYPHMVVLFDIFCDETRRGGIRVWGTRWNEFNLEPALLNRLPLRHRFVG